MADDTNKDDKDKDNGSNGIGIGAIATGLAAAVTIPTVVGAVTLKDPAKTAEDLAAAKTAHAKLEAENAAAIQAARIKVMADSKKSGLEAAMRKAEAEAATAKAAHDAALNNALTDWKTKGSPAAIATNDPVKISESQKNAERYINARDAIESDQKHLEKATKEIRVKFESEAKATAAATQSSKKAELRTAFATENKEMLKSTPVAAGATPPEFGTAHLEEFIKWKDEVVTKTTAAEMLAHQDAIPQFIKDLPKAEQEAVLAKLESFYITHKGITVEPAAMEAELQALLTRTTGHLAERIETNKAIVTGLEGEMKAATGPAVTEAAGKLAAAESTAKTASKAYTEALAVHAGKEVQAIETSTANIVKLEKIAERLKVLEGKTGIGRFFSKAQVAATGSPWVFAAGALASLGAVLGISYLMNRSKKSDSYVEREDARRAANARGAEPSPAVG